MDLYFWLTTIFNTPETAGGPGGRDRTLAVKSLKETNSSEFFNFLKYFTYFHASYKFKDSCQPEI